MRKDIKSSIPADIGGVDQCYCDSDDRKDDRSPLLQLLAYGKKLTPGRSAILMFLFILLLVLATNHGGHDHDDEVLTV